jgi:hypothetical protein
LGNRYAKVALHISLAFGSIAILLLTDQNARVLLYTYVFNIFYRMPTVWYIASFHDSGGTPAALLKYCREPGRFDRGKPARDARTREPAGLAAYQFGIATLLFMVVIMVLMAEGPQVVSAEVLVLELVIAALLALLFWIDDLFGGQLIVARDKAVYQNLGYNTPAMNFMLAAIFIAGFFWLVFMVVATMLLGLQPNWSPALSWGIVIVVALLKLAFQVRADLGNPKGFAYLSKYDQ